MWREVTSRSITSVCGCLKTEATGRYRLLKNIKYCLHNVQQKSDYGKDNTESFQKEKHEYNIDKEDSSCKQNESLVSTSGKYKIFKDEDSEVIFDIEEERKKIEIESEIDTVDEFAGIDLTRGREGVFDVGQLVEVLKKQKARDIFVVTVPRSIGYVSEMVIATGRSPRHLQAIIEFLYKLYKKKKRNNDPIPKVEGEDSKDWKALDLGNIALHVFLKSAREEYDLESLWALGAEYDNLSQKADDPLIELLKTPLGIEGLEPASSNVKN